MTYNLPNGWKRYKLDNVGEIVSGGTPSTKVKEYFDNGKIPWITPKDLSRYNSKYISRGERNITELGLRKSSAKIYPKGTVLFTSRAPIGYVAIASNEVTTNQGFKSIIPDYKLTTSDFIYYLLKFNTDKIKNVGSGSTFSEVSGKTMKEIDIILPPYGEQKSIANVLSSLDEKIENNTAILANLEEQAQAIFKSWFIDFEPFQEQKFMESELGQIPHTFEVKKLIDLYRLKSGFAFKSKDWSNSGMPIIKIKNINPPTIDYSSVDYINNSEVLKRAQEFKVNGGEIIIALTGATTGKFGIVPKNHDSYINQRAGLFYDITNSGYGFLYGLLNQNPFINKIIELAQGSAQANLSPKDVNSLLIPYEKKAFLTINSILNPLVNHIAHLTNENEVLTHTRDILLPKLMSGEIRINEAVDMK